jgi:xanthine/uracil permease
MGAALVGGILEGILGLCARYWRRFIPPIVAATVVASIGFSLLGIGANSFGGGFGNPDFGDAKYIIVGTITLISCIGFNVLAKSFYKQLSVLFGLVVAELVDQKMQRLAEQKQITDTGRLAVWTALDLAGELYKLKQDYEKLLAAAKER